MANRHLPLQAGDDLLVEDLGHQADVRVQAHSLPVTDGDPGALLPAVLQGV